MATDFSWIYLLIFLAIPLSRIIPRLLAKNKMKDGDVFNPFKQRQIQQSFESSQKPKEIRPQTTDMLVLGELIRGAKTFENIQKNTGINRKELNSVLEELEKKRLMKVENKQGLLGPKIELYATKKGNKEFQSYVK